MTGHERGVLCELACEDMVIRDCLKCLALKYNRTAHSCSTCSTLEIRPLRGLPYLRWHDRLRLAGSVPL